MACLTDRDVVPDSAARYIKKPENGKKRFESDYSPSDLQDVVHGKVKRAEGGNTIVCVSDHWTFEYDLARYGCAELMFVAIQLAIKAEAKGESLDEQDELLAIDKAKVDWASLASVAPNADALASDIYEPLAVGKASKAVTAQYAAHLVATGEYGVGDDLFAKLPPYLQRALNWLTRKPGAA